MAVIAVTSAVMMPIVKTGKQAVSKYAASQNIHQLGTATRMYTSDYDDTFPPAMQAGPDSVKAWFGTVNIKRETDTSTAVLTPYTKGAALKDPANDLPNYLGDHSGFGYNWCSLGSNTCESGQSDGFQHSQDPANESQISNTAHMIAYATSAYYHAPWKEGGDGKYYDYGFISPPSMWKDGPDMDFRHLGPTQQNEGVSGIALTVFADGSSKPFKKGQVTDKLFNRQEAQN